MSEPNYRGVLLGIVVNDEGIPHIGLSTGGPGGPLIMGVSYALDLFDQLGSLLETLGVDFDMDDGSMPLDDGEQLH
jgi:hypothetical protein